MSGCHKILFLILKTLCEARSFIIRESWNRKCQLKSTVDSTHTSLIEHEEIHKSRILKLFEFLVVQFNHLSDYSLLDI